MLVPPAKFLKQEFFVCRGDVKALAGLFDK